MFQFELLTKRDWVLVVILDERKRIKRDTIANRRLQHQLQAA
jgi:hypothetical protein